MKGAVLRIGDVVRATGLTADAIRFYEREGLLPRAARTSGGFRQYEPSAVDRLSFIKQAQAHGLSLREIRDLLAAQGRPGRERCERVRQLVENRLRLLDEQRRELDAFCATLREYLAMCDRALAQPGQPTCPVVEDLGRERRKQSAG